MKYTTYNELSDVQKNLLNAAKEVMENSYSPYYHFFVGAAILTQDGEIITGTNFEDSAGASICAERAAILRANAEGKRMYDSIAIISRGETFDTEEPSASCGHCRQMIFDMSQISDKDIEIILSNTKMTKIILTSINELLPLAFGPKDLGVDVDKYRK